MEGNKDKILTPKKSESFKKAVQVEAGQYCTFVIFADGSLFSCGKVWWCFPAGVLYHEGPILLIWGSTGNFEVGLFQQRGAYC